MNIHIHLYYVYIHTHKHKHTYKYIKTHTQVTPVTTLFQNTVEITATTRTVQRDRERECVCVYVYVCILYIFTYTQHIHRSTYIHKHIHTCHLRHRTLPKHRWNNRLRTCRFHADSSNRTTSARTLCLVATTTIEIGSIHDSERRIVHLFWEASLRDRYACMYVCKMNFFVHQEWSLCDMYMYVCVCVLHAYKYEHDCWLCWYINTCLAYTRACIQTLVTA